jgi:hypothetical protein
MKLRQLLRRKRTVQFLVLGEVTAAEIPSARAALQYASLNSQGSYWLNVGIRISRLGEDQLQELYTRYEHFRFTEGLMSDQQNLPRLRSYLQEMLGHELTDYVVILDFEAYAVAAKALGDTTLIDLLCAASHNPDGYRAGVVFGPRSGRSTPAAVHRTRFENTHQQAYDRVVRNLLVKQSF